MGNQHTMVRPARYRIPVVISVLLLSASAALAQRNDGKISESLHSRILHEDRSIMVRVPGGLSPGQRVPVVYVLDAEANFDAVVAVLHDLDKEKRLVSPLVVVGVGNIWSRYRDYSPTPVAVSRYVDVQTAATTGGGPKFISFLKQELIPYVDKKYPVSSTRIIIGHSLGGLIAVDMLLNHREMFTHTLAIDPSMWWDQAKVLAAAPSLLKANDFGGRSLYLAIANVKSKDMDERGIRNDKSDKTELARPVVALADLLRSMKSNGMRFDCRFHANEDHMSVFRPAVRAGLLFALPD